MLDKEQADINGGMFGLQKRLDNELKVNSTTDLVILNSYVPKLQKMKITEITALAGQAIRMQFATLLVPALRLSAKFRDAQDLLKIEAEKSILEDDYDTLQNLRQQQKDVDQVEIGLLKTIGAYSEAAKQIKAKVVSKDEMPGMG